MIDALNLMIGDIWNYFDSNVFRQRYPGVSLNIQYSIRDTTAIDRQRRTGEMVIKNLNRIFINSPNPDNNNMNRQINYNVHK